MRCDDAGWKPGRLLDKSISGWEALTGCTPGGCGLYRRQTGDASCVLLLAEPMVHAHIYQNSCQLAGGLRGTLN